MFSKITCAAAMLLLSVVLLCFTPCPTAADDSWVSEDPLDLAAIADTRWLVVYSLDDYSWADELVLGSDVSAFDDATVYLECYDRTGNFWGIVQYGALASHDGENGYMVTYYNYGEADTDGTYFLWDFIKTNGLETGNFIIEDELTGTLSEPLPHIAVRITDTYAPSVVHEVTGDDKMGLADIIWNLQSLTGLR